ncbi:shikimate kinase [Cupriavidus pauculus]|uniref:Shikimate kinase n=1 Tax=Cupriavidus pauculus TaxID=82633 RepID=A0A2N5C336_9BURK|nr:shikimate kinase [Cupriavidus pauculus]PLP96632.1 shikimate kinase [Cupriavidus pauculus]
MGAGKTTIGRTVARKLGRPFFDTDHEIESRCGVRITTIFELEGEEGFRRRETRILDELTQRSGIVLATGGGIVLRPENREMLRARGHVIYLDAALPELWRRVRRNRNRPLLQVDNPRARLEALFCERDPLYREIAHLIMPAHAGTVAQAAASVLALLGLPAPDIAEDSDNDPAPGASQNPTQDPATHD